MRAINACSTPASTNYMSNFIQQAQRSRIEHPYPGLIRFEEVNEHGPLAECRPLR